MGRKKKFSEECYRDISELSETYTDSSVVERIMTKHGVEINEKQVRYAVNTYLKKKVVASVKIVYIPMQQEYQVIANEVCLEKCGNFMDAINVLLHIVRKMRREEGQMKEEVAQEEIVIEEVAPITSFESYTIDGFRQSTCEEQERYHEWIRKQRKEEKK